MVSNWQIRAMPWLCKRLNRRRLLTDFSLQQGVRWMSQSNKATYDTVIVGAGSAGCVLANRLSEGRRKVLVLEAGPPDNWWDFRIHMPAALMYNLMDDRYNWFYHTVPQKNVNNRVMYWPRGRVWGGSSSLNAMVYIRGHAYDYDRWEAEGAKGWSYSSCLPYFRKAQSHELGCNEYRGGSGPLHVSRGTGDNPLHRAFLEATQQAGYPYTSDVNGYQQEGFGWFDMTVHKGVRWNTSKAYLRPALKTGHVTIKSKALATRILFEGKKAVGVEYQDKNSGQLHQVYAESEVILSGGAINSPQLLMLSGVGPAGHLKSVSVEPLLDLPGVGQNLQDHLDLYLQQKCTKPITLYSAQWKFPHNMIKIGLQWMATRTGLGASSHLESGGFIRTDPGQTHPNIQYHFLPSTVNDHGRAAGPCHAYQVHVGTMRDRSRGELRLQSNDPRVHPLLDPNYFSHPEDMREVVTSIRLTREIMAQPAFDSYRGEELLPGADHQTDEEIEAFVRRTCDTSYHPSCTCKMGSSSDPMAVVDEHGRVHGLNGLRVVDASIMPSIVTGNLNGPTIMIAEKCADAILGKEPLPPSNADVWKPRFPELQRDSLATRD